MRLLPALALTLLFTIGAARAQSVVYLADFGSTGNGNGEFSVPNFVGLNHASGDIYVGDFGNSRVERFLTHGIYLGQWGGFNSVYGIAVNDITGDVYVAEPYRISRFNAAGTLQNSWVPPIDTHNDSGIVGLAINQSTGDLYAADSQGTGGGYVLRYDSLGTFLDGFGTTGSAPGQFYGAGGIAINQTTGQVYVTNDGFDPDNNETVRVMRFSAAGIYETEWGSKGIAPNQFSIPYGIAVDKDGAVYVVSLGSNRVTIFDADGHFIAYFGDTGPHAFQFPRGVAVDDFGLIYVADGNHNRVSEWQGADLKYTPPTQPDQPPTVTVKGKKRIKTAKGIYKLKGTAADPDGNLVRVEVKVGKKGFRPARGTTQWKFKVHLKPGNNKVIVRAVDASGQTSIIAKRKIKRLSPPTA